MIVETAKKVWNQYRVWTPSVATKNILYHTLTREKRRSFGTRNEARTIYVIRSIRDRSRLYIGPVHNLLANYFYVLSHLQYAQLRGWTPVVDQLNYPVYNSLSEPVNGTSNAWEYFWRQPGSVSLEEAYTSKNVILSKQSWYWEWDMGYDVENYTDPQVIERFHQLSELVPLNQSTQQYVQEVKTQLGFTGGKTLGVSFRFGGHSKDDPNHSPGHPIQPEIGELIEHVHRNLDAWGMDRVFFASDESDAVRRFRQTFGERLLVLDRQRREAGVQYSAARPDPMYVPQQKHQTTRSYLAEMELLSECDALIGSVTSGLRYAVVRNGGRYQKTEILDRGRFPDQRKSGGRK